MQLHMQYYYKPVMQPYISSILQVMTWISQSKLPLPAEWICTLQLHLVSLRADIPIKVPMLALLLALKTDPVFPGRED